MKAFILSVSLIFTSSFSQVGIGTTNPRSVLDVSSSDSGILFPSFSLTSVNQIIDITTGVQEDGELIYNTNNTFDQGKGFYFWDDFIGEWKSVNLRSPISSLDPFLENNYTGVITTAQTGTFYDEDVTDVDPVWLFNSSRDNDFIGTSTTNPLIFGYDNKPMLTLANRQLYNMNRGNKNRPSYSFYDAPQTGMSATVSWVDRFTGKGRQLISTTSPSTNFSHSQINFSVDGDEIFRVLGDNIADQQGVTIFGDIKVVADSGSARGDYDAKGNIKLDGDLISQGKVDGKIVTTYHNTDSPNGVVKGNKGQLYVVLSGGNKGLYFCTGNRNWTRII